QFLSATVVPSSLFTSLLRQFGRCFKGVATRFRPAKSACRNHRAPELMHRMDDPGNSGGMMRACPPPLANPSRPRLALPAGVCDVHCHVMGPAERFPFADERAYTPDDAPKERLAV